MSSLYIGLSEGRFVFCKWPVSFGVGDQAQIQEFSRGLQNQGSGERTLQRNIQGQSPGRGSGGQSCWTAHSELAYQSNVRMSLGRGCAPSQVRKNFDMWIKMKRFSAYLRNMCNNLPQTTYLTFTLRCICFIYFLGVDPSSLPWYA